MKNVRWPPYTVLFQSQACLSDLLLIILALPACTVGMVHYWLNPAKFLTYWGFFGGSEMMHFRWKWSHFTGVGLIYSMSNSFFFVFVLFLCFCFCFVLFAFGFVFYLGSTWRIAICLSTAQNDTFFSFIWLNGFFHRRLANQQYTWLAGGKGGDNSGGVYVCVTAVCEIGGLNSKKNKK